MLAWLLWHNMMNDESLDKIVFFWLVHSIGENIKILIDRPDGQYCFRLHKERVYYVSEEIMKKAGNISRDNLVCLGTCLGKFTKTKKFRLHITSLDYLAPYAQVQVATKFL